MSNLARYAELAKAAVAAALADPDFDQDYRFHAEEANYETWNQINDVADYLADAYGYWDDEFHSSHPVPAAIKAFIELDGMLDGETLY